MERFTDELQAPYVTQGLAQYGSDYYAVLGVPMDAGPDQIRQGYLKAAKSLHPDRYIGNQVGKQEAGQLFSALVTPAYDVLTRTNRHQEYDMMIRLLASKLGSGVALPSHPTVQVFKECRTDVALHAAYTSAAEQLAAHQYKKVSESLAITNELSILNLGFLIYNQRFLEERRAPTAPRPPASTAHTTDTQVPAVVESAPPPLTVNWSGRHFDRGQDFLKRKQYREATQSFKECLRLEPGNADVHAHLGIAFLRQGLPGMARSEFQTAVTLDPLNELARKYMRSLDEPAPQPGTKAAKKPQDGKKGQEPAQNLFNKLWSSLNKPM